MDFILNNLPEILETIMLICFGCSWPISAIKNFKAKTAKATSPAFILLILTGYVAGITGKFFAGKYVAPKEIFVLVMYFINFVSVCANLIIYFINKGYDKKNSLDAAQSPVFAEKSTQEDA